MNLILLVPACFQSSWSRYQVPETGDSLMSTIFKVVALCRSSITCFDDRYRPIRKDRFLGLPMSPGSPIDSAAFRLKQQKYYIPLSPARTDQWARNKIISLRYIIRLIYTVSLLTWKKTSLCCCSWHSPRTATPHSRFQKEVGPQNILRGTRSNGHRTDSFGRYEEKVVCHWRLAQNEAGWLINNSNIRPFAWRRNFWYFLSLLKRTLSTLRHLAFSLRWLIIVTLGSASKTNFKDDVVIMRDNGTLQRLIIGKAHLYVTDINWRNCKNLTWFAELGAPVICMPDTFPSHYYIVSTFSWTGKYTNKTLTFSWMQLWFVQSLKAAFT